MAHGLGAHGGLMLVALCCGCSAPVATGGPDGSTDADDGATDSGMIDGGTPDSGIPDAGLSRPGGGVTLFTEHFEDTSFAGRGWYDGTGATLSTTEHVAGSTRSFECRYAVGATGCSGGTPARHKFAPSQTAYLSLWLKFSPNWVGSGRAYHPHLFHFTTSEDGDWVGPATSHLTTYTEMVGGRPLLALQDSLNVDPACVLRNNDTFVGCGGNFATWPFTEARSAMACNGLQGDVDGRDCFSTGTNTWYSARMWRAPAVSFTDADWHFVEAYFALNSIQGGVGVPDGEIRYWQDGKLLIGSDRILFRTGALPNMRFNQFLMLPYIGDGSPAQSFWVDELTVATAPP
ncbi:MAG: hypothetical protein ACYC8T_08070 [Myxococcaceae bacterium]